MRAVEETTRELQRVRALDAAARLAEEAFGARLWFVRILGRRWSYVAGYRPQTPVGAHLDRIPLGNGNFGLVSEDWGALSSEECCRLIALFDEMVARGRQP